MAGRMLWNGVKRTTYPAAAAISLLALVSPVDQASGNAADAKATEPGATVVGRPVDGGNPLFLTPPPRPEPASMPPPPGEPAHAATLPAFGVPATVLAAYQRAAERLGQTAPGCHLAWPVLAGIGKVESNHARNGDVAPDGTVIDPIYGPTLDGSSGFAAIPDGGGWARAAGPMQFIPSTWTRWGVDGNGDGRADPQNVFDATLSAADYLCADGRDLSTGPGLRDAILSYNDSPQYLDTVAAWIRAYQNNGGPVPDQPYGPGTFETAPAAPAPARPGQPVPGTPSPPPPGKRPPPSPPPNNWTPTSPPGSGSPQPPPPSSPRPSSSPLPPPLNSLLPPPTGQPPAPATPKPAGPLD